MTLPLILSGEDDNRMSRSSHGEIATLNKIVVISGTERGGRLQEGNVSFLPIELTAFSDDTARVAIVRHTGHLGTKEILDKLKRRYMQSSIKLL